MEEMKYDENLYKTLHSTTVRELIEVLKTFSPDTEILLCGFQTIHLHVQKGGGVINMDVESKNYFNKEYDFIN